MKFKKGNIPWNKEKKGIFSEETIKKMRKAKEGYIPWNTGLTKETDKRVRQYGEHEKGRHVSPQTEFKKGIQLVEDLKQDSKKDTL